MKNILFLFIAFFMLNQVNAQDAIVLNSSTSITINGNKKVTEYNIRIQVNNQNGDQYTSFQLPHSKINKLKNLRGTITDLGGNTVHKLSKKGIITSSRFSNTTFYSDNFIKRFTLKHNVYPYIVECSYSYETSSFLHIAYWSPIEDTDIPTKSAELRLTYPKEYKFSINSNFIDEPAIDQTNTTANEKTLVWKSSYSVLDNKNTMSPSFYELIPILQIIPLDFNYIIDGSFRSWTKFGVYLSELSEDLKELPISEQNKIDNLTAGINDKKEIVKKLYHYLQDNTRYINVNIDFGGMQPYPADYVCTNKYGDCKALSNYMQAMLKYKNIESHTAIVYAGENPTRIKTDFPSQQFNHVILCVPLKNDSIWLECTSNTSPCNYLGTFTQNRNVLLVNGLNSKIIKTPKLSMNQSKSVHKYIFNKPTSNSIDAEISFILKGEAFENLNGVLTYNNETETEDYINYYIDIKNLKIKNWEANQINRDTASIILNSTIECPNPFQTIGNFIKINHPDLKIPHFEKINERNFDVRINAPICSIDTIIYNYDFSNYSFKNPPTDSRTTNFGEYKINRLLNGNQLTIIRTIKLPIQDISLNDYSNFYEFYSFLLKSSNSSLLIKNEKK